MPDISYSIQAQVQKGALSQAFSVAGVTADMTATGLIATTLSLGTSTTQISTAALTSVGMCFARSLATESTHVVTIGRLDGATLYGCVSLRGGEAAVFRMAPGNYAANAAVAGSRLVVTITEG
jgi:phosphate/sulfate permease